jgi:hypothetical protein
MKLKLPTKHQQSEVVDWAENWILINAIGVNDPSSGHLGIRGTFQLGSEIKSCDWIFPRLPRATLDKALTNLQCHIGRKVSALVDLPPTDLWIFFENGAKWGVSDK